MMGILRIAVVLTAFVISAALIAFTVEDYKKQLTYIKGSRYRREHGGFSLEAYQNEKSPIKSAEWLRQQNRGFPPDTYAKKIKYENHFEDCACLAAKKGI